MLDFYNVLEIFWNTLDKLFPCRKKFIAGNNAPFMNKTVSKDIMTRSNLITMFKK